ncbi:MAG TPA: MFS transporter [Solirubrobacterales bacterium]|nr:MFS transporter [Solirubrobacterales bacterium]
MTTTDIWLYPTPPRVAIRRLALARGITYSGGNAAFWALSAVLYEATGSPLWVAAAALASFSVPAVLSPVAGFLGDRFDRRKIMVVSELAGAVTFLGMAVAGSPAALLGLRLVASAASAPLVPATSAALPKLVPDALLEQANGSLAKAGTAGALVGTALAGIILTSGSGSWVFVLNTITFLISTALILSVRGDFRPTRTTARKGQLVEGFGFLRRHPLLRPVSAAYMLIFIGVGVSYPAEIVLASEFGVGSLGYAALVALWGLGALAGATLAERIGGIHRHTALLAAAGLALGLGFLTVSFAPLFVLALIGMAAAGSGDGLWEVTQTSVIQRVTPDSIRSRVLAGSEAMMQTGVAVGLAISGLVTAVAGAGGAFAVAGAASLMAAIIVFLRVLPVGIATPNRSRPTAPRAHPEVGGRMGSPSSSDGHPAPVTSAIAAPTA